MKANVVIDSGDKSGFIISYDLGMDYYITHNFGDKSHCMDFRLTEEEQGLTVAYIIEGQKKWGNVFYGDDEVEVLHDSGDLLLAAIIVNVLMASIIKERKNGS